MQLRKPLKFLLTLLITILAYKLIVIALPLMNRPSDLSFYGGGIFLVLTVVGTIALVRLLWRRRKHESLRRSH